GRIGVQIAPVPRDGFEDFGLKTRTGAVVAQVSPGGAAAKGGIEPGDVILEFNGRPVASQNELVKMVVGTKPGTSVPVKLLRNKQEKTLNITIDELDLEAEQTARQNRQASPDAPAQEEQGSGLGVTLQNLTPQIARRLQLPAG